MIIDVREIDEIATEGRVQGALSIPLNELKNNIEAIVKLSSIEPIQLLCKSGSRAQIAKDKIENEHKQTLPLEIIKGGLKGIESEKIIHSEKKTSISIMRQVMIIAGLMIAIFSLTGFFINPLLHWLPFAIGSALSLAGLSGFCPMALLLGKMPWNK